MTPSKFTTADVSSMETGTLVKLVNAAYDIVRQIDNGSLIDSGDPALLELRSALGIPDPDRKRVVCVTVQERSTNDIIEIIRRNGRERTVLSTYKRPCNSPRSIQALEAMRSMGATVRKTWSSETVALMPEH